MSDFENKWVNSKEYSEQKGYKPKLSLQELLDKMLSFSSNEYSQQQTKELEKIKQAYFYGMPIQKQYKKDKYTWADCQYPTWDTENYNYRIKE